MQLVKACQIAELQVSFKEGIIYVILTIVHVLFSLGAILSKNVSSQKRNISLSLWHSVFLKEKWASQKDLLEMTRRRQLIFHIYILISKYSKPPPFHLRLHSPNVPDKLFDLSYHCAISSVRTLWIVLETLCNHTSFLWSKLLHLFHHYTFLTREKKLKIQDISGKLALYIGEPMTLYYTSKWKEDTDGKIHLLPLSKVNR